MLQSARGTSLVEVADCVELASMLVAVDVGAAVMPVVCSWALTSEGPLASSTKQAAKCCLLRPFAMAAFEDDLVRRRQ